MNSKQTHKKRKNRPWILQYSRPLIAAVATCGTTITGYLTYSNLMQGEVICPTNGCNRVLASPYASIGNIPLSLFGFLAYLAMIAVAIMPLIISEKTGKTRRSIQAVTQQTLLLGGTVMMLFSLYLLYLMGFVMQTFCLYCLVSAGLSFVQFLLILKGFHWQDIGQVIFTLTVMSILMLLISLGLFNLSTSQMPESGRAEIALAKHLNQIEAKMYGAFWCDHCHQQKQLFGAEAMKLVNYIECDPSGENPQTTRCQAAGITGYPTWEINDRQYSGVKALDQLAELSSYEGSLDFQSHHQ